MNTYLGNEYTDIITGFKGICTGFVEYLTGCNQVLLVPSAKTKEEARWVDVQRVKRTSKQKVVLDNSNANGFDVTPPVR